EEDLVLLRRRQLPVDAVDPQEREVTFGFLWRTNGAGDGVAGAQREAPDLRRRDVDVVRAREIVVVRRAQEAEAVGQGLEDAVGPDLALLVGLGVQEGEDELLPPHRGGALDGVLVRELGELCDALALHLGEVHAIVPRKVKFEAWRAKEGGGARVALRTADIEARRARVKRFVCANVSPWRGSGPPSAGAYRVSPTAGAPWTRLRVAASSAG